MKNFIETISFNVYTLQISIAKKCFILPFLSLLIFLSNNLYAQVGIGTTTPQAYFNVAGDKDVLFGDDMTASGKKLIWFGGKGAFRAGSVSGNFWDPMNVGENSFAFGEESYAKGLGSVAIGEYSKASGDGSLGLGNNSNAFGDLSVSLGARAYASGNSAIAIGAQSSAFGAYSMAFGHDVNAKGNYSMALGQGSDAEGEFSTVIGYDSYSSGDYSIALGSNVSTNNKKGSFAFGDATQLANLEYLKNDLDFQMVMRFQNGYKLFTNYQATIGVALPHGANAWTVTSDSTRKENFLKADGADFLAKISKMRLGSWNYKGQDVKTFRHYGPMAQDFYAAFGKDSLGVIGEDKSINQADFDGVNLIAIKALIQEVNQLKAEITVLKEKESVSNIRFGKIEAMLNERENQPVLTFLP